MKVEQQLNSLDHTFKLNIDAISSVLKHLTIAEILNIDLETDSKLASSITVHWMGTYINQLTNHQSITQSDEFGCSLRKNTFDQPKYKALSITKSEHNLNDEVNVLSVDQPEAVNTLLVPSLNQEFDSLF